MGVTTVIGKTFLSLDAVHLGRLVTSTANPDFDYFEVDAKQLAKITSNATQNYCEVLKSEKDKRFTAELTRLVALSRIKQTGKSTQVSTQRLIEYKLDNPVLWWRNLITIKETQDWIKNTIKGGDTLYLVTGYFTFFDAEVTEVNSSNILNKVDMRLPVGLAIQTSTGIIVPGSLADPHLLWDKTVTDEELTKFRAPGEQICAVTYHKVKWRWFSSKDVAKTMLEKRDILTMYGVVTKKGGKKDNKDAVECVMDDEIDEFDNERHLQYVSENGENFVL